MPLVDRRLSGRALSLVPLFAPSAARACAVCFGASDNTEVIKAFYLGGAFLLVCTFGLLGALIYAIVRLEKARQVEDRKHGLLDGPAA